MKLDHDLRLSRLDEKLILDFFWRFSVFECALKRGNFLRAGRNNAAEADWDAFANAIRGKFAKLEVNETRRAIEYVLAHPPRRQVVDEGQLKWKAPEPRGNESEEAYVIRLVRRTRNNLFHGGKYHESPETDVARDVQLLKSSLAILELCYGLSPELGTYAHWQG